MDKAQITVRLDEILIAEGTVSEEQVAEALEYQKGHGGKLGSHLLRFGWIDESGLLQALEKQFRCESVNLSEIEIPQIVLKFIPARVARARNVIPFDYDSENNILKVACENPRENHLVDELNFVARGKVVKLYIAAEIALKSAVARHYPPVDQSRKKPGEPVEVTNEEAQENPNRDASAPVETQAAVSETNPDKSNRAVLLVTDNFETDNYLKQAFERESYEVVISDSADSALDLVGEKHIDAVLIRDTVKGACGNLIDRLRKLQPSTRIRHYDSVAGLLLDESIVTENASLLEKNLDLFTTLLASKEKLPSNHAGTVGDYVNRLCRRLQLQETDRLAITNAAYLHDLARFYYGGSDEPDYERQLVKLTVKLLDSLNYSPLVVGVLRSMYLDLMQKYTELLPIEALGGNIVTVVDIFCENMPAHERISLDQFDKVKSRFRQMVGKLFLAEVVDAFMDMVHEDILSAQTNEMFSQVMILCDDEEAVRTVEQRLKGEGFRTLVQRTVEQFAELFQRTQPDIQILIKSGPAGGVCELVDDVISRGIAIQQVSTFLVADASVALGLTALLEKGIEDIIPADENLDLLIAKMRKIRNRLQAEAAQSVKVSEEADTRGLLEDMSLFILLKAMNASRKTAKVTVTSDGRHLLIFLNQGEISFAQCNGRSGVEAIYQGFTWTTGNWTVTSVKVEEIPEPNVDIENKSLLAEGRRLLNEVLGASQTGTASTWH